MIISRRTCGEESRPAQHPGSAPDHALDAGDSVAISGSFLRLSLFTLGERVPLFALGTPAVGLPSQGGLKIWEI